MVAVSDVYPAGEQTIDGINAETLVKAIKASGHKGASKLASFDDLPAFVRKAASAGDVVVCLGAGDITTHANALLRALPRL